MQIPKNGKRDLIDISSAGAGVAFPPDLVVLCNGGSVPGSKTCCRWALNVHHKKKITKPIVKKRWCCLSGLRRRPFSAGRRRLDPSNPQLRRKPFGHFFFCSHPSTILPAPCKAIQTQPRSNNGGPTMPTTNGRGSGTSTWRSNRKGGVEKFAPHAA